MEFALYKETKSPTKVAENIDPEASKLPKQRKIADKEIKTG